MPAYYMAHAVQFVTHNTEEIVGKLSLENGRSGYASQTKELTDSWRIEVQTLRKALSTLPSQDLESWTVLFEYPIPRREKRIDVVILAGGVILVLEFKTKQSIVNVANKIQLEDYCLDLRDFHKESSGKKIIPILVEVELQSGFQQVIRFNDIVADTCITNGSCLGNFLLEIANQYRNLPVIAGDQWDQSAYEPTPTIIEAATYLYAGKAVAEISRSQAGSQNLTKTTHAVLDAIKTAQDETKKIICFITGVPGAGKTLAGLNIVHNQALHNNGSLGVFLSGNGPLIRVLREALALDQSRRIPTIKRNESRRQVTTFIQNVHEFLTTYFENKSAIPVDHIVVFDEAQRAWNREQSKRKFQRDYSESEMLLEIMDRHPDWSVIIALIGGGQEINTGEAGLAEWGRVIQERFPEWEIFISSELISGSHSTGGMTLFGQSPVEGLRLHSNPDLHLQVSIRSYKAEKLSEWVAYVLERQPNKAKQIMQEHLQDYPIFISRDLETARNWVRKECRGSRRGGIITSSGALRLKRFGIDPKDDVEVEHWFLQPSSDVRSSSFLEQAVTEFDIQGLEIDFSCVCWEADLREVDNQWAYYKFLGSKWQRVNQFVSQQYLVNKYRVLLTRARQGMVIFVQSGDRSDPTRNPKWYNDIAAYLLRCGVRELPGK